MRLLREMGERLGIAREILSFFWHSKMWWMTPIVIVLVLLGLVIGFGTVSGVGPLIYTLF